MGRHLASPTLSFLNLMQIPAELLGLLLSSPVSSQMGKEL